MQGILAVAFVKEAVHIHDDDLSLYSKGALAPGPSAALASHIAHCARCRSSLEDVRELNRSLAALRALLTAERE